MQSSGADYHVYITVVETLVHELTIARHIKGWKKKKVSLHASRPALVPVTAR
jgi:hypothetical protein